MKNIVFTNTLQHVNLDEFKPVPASKSIPDWYKNLDSYMGKEKKPDGNGMTTATMKKCMPVFDAITGGYILRTHTDLFITQKDGAPYYEWASFDAITFHGLEQAPNHPLATKNSYPKFINPWGIKTPKGYSCLFISPLHRDNVINILPGIVDTDNYFAPVNFPFQLTDQNFEGLIKAGTDIVQIIPFKRDKWNIKFDNSDKAINDQALMRNKLRSFFFDSYKNNWWTKKEFK